jgi:hypothetical protein
MNSQRRRFLKLIALGGAVALAGRVFGGKALALVAGGGGKKSLKEPKGDEMPSEIKTVKRGKSVVFVDRSSGDEIFILERE